MSFKTKLEATQRELRATEAVSKRQREAMRVALEAARDGRCEVAAAVLADAIANFTDHVESVTDTCNIHRGG